MRARLVVNPASGTDRALPLLPHINARLDVLMVPRMPVREFVAALQQIASGDGASGERVRRFRASSFELRFSRAVRVNVDGELLEAERCTYGVKPGAARFFCGPSPHASHA